MEMPHFQSVLLRRYPTLLLAVSLVGCYYHEDPPTSVVLCEGASQEPPKHLLIPYMVNGLGSAHYPGIIPWERKQLDALDVRSELKLVDSDSLTLYLYNGRIRAEKISGHISFENEFVDIQLKYLTHPRPGISTWAEYPRNGKYVLRPGSCVGS